MMSSEIISGILVFAYAVLGVWMYRRANSSPEQETEPEEDAGTGFEFLTVRQQIEQVHKTSDALADLEDLQLQIEECSEDDLLPVQLEWMSRDGDMHSLTVFANGIDMTTQCLHTLTEAEIHDTRALLAHQCQVLARQARNAKNCAKNDVKIERGGESVDEVLRKVREAHRG